MRSMRKCPGPLAKEEVRRMATAKKKETKKKETKKKEM